MLLEKLSNYGIEVRPHIESRLKTLKKKWAIMYDMMLNTSGFGCDSTLKMVTAEDDIWEAYVANRATGKDAQAVEDILQELEIEDLIGAAEEAEVNPSNPNESANANTPTSRDILHAHLPHTEDPGSASSGKERKKNEANFSTIFQAVNTMAVDMKEACMILSKSVHSDIVQEKFLELPGALHSVDGMTSAQVHVAIQKFGNHLNYIMLFFGTDLEDRLEIV
ncbi:hypothetical protein CDL15_Pgr007956 [Punica granatum]|uniref:Myb/SANT-like domain-containing protein n=1 Tax=Punica granatum TaxID=22663 RepID=A0A218XAD4_PUNGR|nr:hypothetical protein CDL15_Pgr007956 [Punica granatum]